MQHYHASDIRVLTVILKAPSWKRQGREACQGRASLLVKIIDGLPVAASKNATSVFCTFPHFQEVT